MTRFHQTLASGGWQKLSLVEQLANVGSEISRSAHWETNDQDHCRQAFDRALELLDMTIGDDRWRGRLKELTRLRELLIDAFLGGETYGSRLADFSQYFFDFALAARCNK